MSKLINLKAFVLGATFIFVMAAIGSWWFAIPFWMAALIGLACMVILGVIAAFENGDSEKKDKPE